MWSDTNLTETSLSFSNGYWGFLTDNNSTLFVSNIQSLQIYQQVQNLALNPGDDLSTALDNILQAVYVYTYSDQLGRYVATILNSSDTSTFTYNNILYELESDNSDQQTINEVIVTGTNVSSTAQNTVSIAQLGVVRSTTITDYSITTYQDALTRAQQELVAQNRFNNQNTPQNPMNVGSEIFDAITITNTGNNSTNTNIVCRIYNQEFDNDGSNGRYSIQIEAGTL